MVHFFCGQTYITVFDVLIERMRMVGILYDAKSKVFHLQGNDVSYVMQIVKNGYLAHLYWGKRIENYAGSNPLSFINRTFSPNPDPNDRTFSLDTLPQEYPVYGNTDFRSPAYQIQLENGSTITELRYKSHSIFSGKPRLEGLPATYVEEKSEAQTLEVVLEDLLIGLEVILTYTIFEHFNTISRSVRFENKGSSKLKILRALSANVDFRDAQFDLLTLYGSHTNECNIDRKPIRRDSVH